MTTGLDIETIRDTFDLPRLEAFGKYTNRYPPQHILIASYFGYGKSEAKPENNEADIAALLQTIPQVQR